MKKKIIAAVMAITLLLVACAMTVGAYNDINGNLDGYLCNYSISDDGDEIYFFAAVYYSGYNPPINNIRIRIQCVIIYTDNSYEYGYVAINNSNGGDIYVPYDSSKTISYIDYEVHVYDNGVYIGTCSEQIPYSWI